MILPLAALPVFAGGWSDPLDTGSLLYPPTGFAADAAGDFQPCRPGSTDSPLSLFEVVDAALCANSQVREVWANARVQAAQVGVARSAWLPSVDADVSSSRARSNGAKRDGDEVGISLSLLLFDFGARAAALENARALLIAANATQDATLQSVFLTAVQAYYQALATQSALDAARESEKAALASLNAAAARYQAGAATPADKLQAQTAWSQAVLNRIQAEGDVRTAQGTLASVVGREANRSVTLTATGQSAPPEHFEQDVDVLVEQAKRRRPDLMAAQARTQAARAQVDAAQAAGRPRLSFGMQGANQRNAGLPDAKTSSLGVTLAIPLFSGFNTHYQVRAAQAQAEAQAAQTEQLRLQVTLDVWNAYQSLLTATQSARTTADLLNSAQQSERVARGRYQAGVGNILDLLNAQSALASARRQRVQALYGWNVARIALAQSMGTLDRDTLQEGSTP